MGGTIGLWFVGTVAICSFTAAFCVNTALLRRMVPRDPLNDVGHRWGLQTVVGPAGESLVGQVGMLTIDVHHGSSPDRNRSGFQVRVQGPKRLPKIMFRSGKPLLLHLPPTRFEADTLARLNGRALDSLGWLASVRGRIDGDEVQAFIGGADAQALHHGLLNMVELVRSLCATGVDVDARLAEHACDSHHHWVRRRSLELLEQRWPQSQAVLEDLVLQLDQRSDPEVVEPAWIARRWDVVDRYAFMALAPVVERIVGRLPDRSQWAEPEQVRLARQWLNRTDLPLPVVSRLTRFVAESEGVMDPRDRPPPLELLPHPKGPDVPS